MNMENHQHKAESDMQGEKC